VGTWTGTVLNFPRPPFDHWQSVYEFTPCPLVEGEVCGWMSSCSLEGQVSGGSRSDMTFEGIEGSSYTFTQGNIYSETQYFTPLGSGDSLAYEGYLTAGSEYPDTWDTYALLRRVGTPGAAKPFSKWLDSIESGKTCPSTG